MPFTVNGIGTSVCGYSAAIHWRKPGLLAHADHDAYECFVFCYLPLFPLRAVHTFNWSGKRYSSIRLRHNRRLIANIYLRIPVLLLIVLGLLFLLEGTWDILRGGRVEWAAISLLIGVVLAGSGAALRRWLQARDGRTRDIRLVIGPSPNGTSDPALWPRDHALKLELAPFDEIRSALSAGQFGRAMHIARLAVAQGNLDGEAATDEILRHPRVVEVLPALRRTPWLRDEILSSTRAA